MQDKKTKSKEKEFEFDAGTVIFGVIGFIVSWINMFLIQLTPVAGHEIWNIKVFAYLSIIFTATIPCVGIGVKNRFWAYGYIVGFSIAGIPFSIFVDLFIGAITFVTTISLFIIMWIIFWKAWRSLSSIKTISE